MDADRVNVYSACDQAIKAMDRENLEAFGRMKTAKWDELNIVRTVTGVYRTSRRLAKKRYYEVAFEAYLLAMAMCGEDPKKAQRMAEKAITDEWIDRILADVDFVTMYRFDTETERKAYRLSETLEVSQKRDRDIDKALKDWSRQLGQYAINVTDYAVVEAFVDDGVTKVQWVAEKDQRVCGECYSYDGKIFPIDEIPPKPHYGCRCRLIPVLD